MKFKAFLMGFVQGVVEASVVVTAAGVTYFVVRDLLDRRSASAE